MASYGAKSLRFAPFVLDTVSQAMKHGPAITVGEVVKVDVAITWATGEISGDDRVVESVAEFSKAVMTAETVDMTDAVAAVIFGATVEAGLVTYKAGDQAPNGSIGFVQSLMRNGVKSAKALYYPKVTAVMGNSNAATKGTAITFGTKTTTFNILQPESGGWLLTKEFATATAEADAIAWLDTQLAAAPPAKLAEEPAAPAGPQQAATEAVPVRSAFGEGRK